VQAAQKYRIPPAVALTLFDTESNFDNSAVNPDSGAFSVAQFLPSTVRDRHLDAARLRAEPRYAIDEGLRYFAELLRSTGDVNQAILRYKGAETPQVQLQELQKFYKRYPTYAAPGSASQAKAPAAAPPRTPSQAPAVPGAAVPAPSAPAPAVPTAPSAPPVPSGPLPGETPGHAARTTKAQHEAAGLPKYSPAQVATGLELFPWLGNPPDLNTLSPAQMNLVNKAAEADKQDTAFNKVLKQAAPELAELASMESSKQMAQRAEELLDPAIVGTRGKVNRLVQQFIQQLPYDEAVKAEYFDPRIPQLEVVSHAIGYIHANAIKRIGAAGGPGQRGVIRYDVEEVTKWFDPFAAGTSVPELKAKLAELQRTIQQARPQVEASLLALGVDPKTLGPIKGRRYGEDAPPGSTSPQQSIDEALDADEAAHKRP